MSTDFTVRGSHSVFQPPERGTAQVRIIHAGPEMSPVFDRVVQDLEAVKASIAALHSPSAGPVTWWSTGQVRTRAERPWNKDGKQLPLVHHASVTVEVKFSDFAELGRWVSHHVASTRGFKLDGVRWALTAANRQQLERTVRTRAVQDAVRRAQEYADALGLGAVSPLAIADAGMLGQGLHPTSGDTPQFARMAASTSDGDAELALSPGDIEISSEVHARFVAG